MNLIIYIFFISSVASLSLQLEMINHTSNPMILLYCSSNSELINQTKLIDPQSRNIFNTLSEILSEGNCYYSWQDVRVEIFWYYHTINNREYYGIVSSPNYQATIRIPSSGWCQYIIIEN